MCYPISIGIEAQGEHSIQQQALEKCIFFTLKSEKYFILS
jgi:hypothetical protein